MLINHPRLCEKFNRTLHPGDFHDARYRRIFEATVGICGSSDDAPLDFIMLVEHMMTNEVLSDCGGLGYLMELASRALLQPADALPRLIEKLTKRVPQESIPADR